MDTKKEELVKSIDKFKKDLSYLKVLIHDLELSLNYIKSTTAEDYTIARINNVLNIIKEMKRGIEDNER